MDSIKMKVKWPPAAISLCFLTVHAMCLGVSISCCHDLPHDLMHPMHPFAEINLSSFMLLLVTATKNSVIWCCVTVQDQDQWNQVTIGWDLWSREPTWSLSSFMLFSQKFCCHDKKLNKWFEKSFHSYFNIFWLKYEFLGAGGMARCTCCTSVKTQVQISAPAQKAGLATHASITSELLVGSRETGGSLGLVSHQSSCRGARSQENKKESNREVHLTASVHGHRCRCTT